MSERKCPMCNQMYGRFDICLNSKCDSNNIIARMNPTKPTNPKDVAAIKRRPSSVRSALVDQEVGVGLLEGAMKYRRHNYRVSGVLASVYYDATNRHIQDWWEGEDYDPDTGLSHITKAIASLYVLRDAMIHDKFVDDRPPALSPEKRKEHREYLQSRIDEIFRKTPGRQPWTEKNKGEPDDAER
jgi:hypothetical protein